MKYISMWITATLTAFILCLALPAIAEDSKCNGPPTLCAQILELQSKLTLQNIEHQKAIRAEAQASENRTVSNAGKMAAGAAIFAVILKLLLSGISNWRDYFNTDKGKAWVRLITLIVGFLAFIATNIGLKMPWWQALILALGGPGAILVHEITKIIPALQGKGPLPPSDPPPAPNAI
jgi:hypothetical protein